MRFIHRHQTPTDDPSPRELANERATERILTRLTEIGFRAQLVSDHFFAELEKEPKTQRGEEN